MPKPVLSDSLFNANDVATAILDHADLSVTNQNFAINDKSSIFSFDSAFSVGDKAIYSFNGFMFVSFIAETSGTPSSGATLATITDANFYPNKTYGILSISLGPDSVRRIKFDTNGSVTVDYPDNSGSSDFFITVNGWYRFTS